MSKGRPIVQVRLSDLTIDRIMVAMAEANQRRRLEEYTLSAWIRQAVQEKLQHLERGKRGWRKRDLPLPDDMAEGLPVREGGA